MFGKRLKKRWILIVGLMIAGLVLAGCEEEVTEDTTSVSDSNEGTLLAPTDITALMPYNGIGQQRFQLLPDLRRRFNGGDRQPDRFDRGRGSGDCIPTRPSPLSFPVPPCLLPRASPAWPPTTVRATCIFV